MSSRSRLPPPSPFEMLTSTPLTPFLLIAFWCRQAAAASAPAPAEESDDSDNDIISDRNTLKAREWDDWKDDNPKGSGNTMSNVG